MTLHKNKIRILLTACMLTLLSVFTGVAVQAADMQQYQLAKNDNGYQLELKTVPVPSITAKQILVRVHAAALNRKDIYMLQGSMPGRDASGHVPLSDGAGEVIAVGRDVREFKVGDPSWVR